MQKRRFAVVARERGLTLNELALLSQCQAEVYHQIRFSGAPDAPDTPFVLAARQSGGRRRLFDNLERSGLIEALPNDQVRVLDAGWATPCNAGATVFFGAPSASEIWDEVPLEPLTRFGPRLPL